MQIASWHNLPSGGGKRAFHNHIRGLAERGHTISLWCPSTADCDYLPLARFATETVLPIELQKIPGVLETVLASAGAVAEPFERIAAMKAHVAQFAGIVNQGNYDVVLATSCRWFYTPFAGRGLRVPSVVYLHEPCRRLYEARPALPWLADDDLARPWWHPRTLQRWIGSGIRVHGARVQAREERTSILAFDRVLVNSAFTRENVLAVFGLDSKVCYPGIDTSGFGNRDADREPFVLSVGEFAPHKNPLFVIRAVGASRRKPVIVWVANSVNEECLGIATRLAADLNVTLDLRTSISEEELVQLYQRASMFLYAPRLEPLGLAPLEAGSCGAPVVAVAEGGVRETVQHMRTGILVDSEPELMAAAIDQLLDDPQKARGLGQAAAQHVRRSWTAAAAAMRVEAHLIEVASSKGRRTEA